MSFRPLSPEGPRFRGLGAPEPEAPGPRELPPPEPGQIEDLEAQLQQAREAGAEEVRSELGAELDQLRDAMASLGPILDELAGLRRRTLIDLAGDIADIVRLFAHRVVADALAMHPEALPGMVRDAVSKLPESEEITIAVAPQSAEALSRALEPRLRDHIVVDPEITGGAIVRTRYASLDTTLQTAEQGLESALQEWLSEQWWVDGEGP
ncbi:MAG TPA: hypothetical protein ENK18_22650 [Deltaproteobacteria bacterium]|nr:hypothetical protein [Deltaproteobacteria bacterium]